MIVGQHSLKTSLIAAFQPSLQHPKNNTGGSAHRQILTSNLQICNQTSFWVTPWAGARCFSYLLQPAATALHLPNPTSMALSSAQHLAATCLVLFLSALLSGFLPFVMQVSEAQLSAMGALGAGLLVGTALAVIIPEGFHAFQSAQHETGVDMPDWTIGAALIAGFVAMLLLDHLQQALTGAGHVHLHSNGHSHRDRCSDEEQEEGRASLEISIKGKSDAAARAFIGLLVHSAADGFAVGASSISSSASLSFLVAVAMVLHKAPVAFGLATYLMSARWSWDRSRRALFTFAATSPAVAILTYVAIVGAPSLSSEASVALCVLFSGGTFLYASCIHILPEIVGDRGRLSLAELLALLTGCLVPLVVSALQGDHHH